MGTNDTKGNGLMRWLGRQVGYVSRALKTDVSESKPLYRNKDVQEVPHPTQPNLLLRRTVIDEVVEDKKKLES